MYRSNILDHFLSFIFATKTSIYNSTSEQIYPSIKITDKDFVFYKNIWDNFIKIKPYGIILKYETMQNDICQILPNEYDASILCPAFTVVNGNLILSLVNPNLFKCHGIIK